MSRLARSAGAVLSVTALCLAASAGPAFGESSRTPGPVAAESAENTTSGTPATQASPTTTSTPVRSRPEPAATSRPSRTEPATTEPSASTPKPSTPASAAPAPVTAASAMADLRLSVWFDKTGYVAHEQITAHARITNAGTAPAAEARVNSTGNLSNAYWTPLPPIEPGQTVESSLTGLVTTESGPLVLTVTVTLLGGAQDANPADNTSTASVPITYVRGSYQGTVYGDRNGNHTMDPGEALPGVRVDISGGHSEVSRTTVTDTAGRFAFPDVPDGRYSTWFTSADWYLTAPIVQVTGVNDPEVLIRGVPVITSALSASAAFTRRAYRVNDVAHLTMTLTNTGPALVTDLAADCWAYPAGQVNAGSLAEGGPGVAVPAGARVAVDLTVRITKEAAAEGSLRVWCSVGAPPRLNGMADAVRATARIPGGLAPKVVGYLGLFRYKPVLGSPASDPLPGVKVYLRDQVTGRVVTRAVTDAEGNFAFYRVPANTYDVGVVGP
ncbi:CARDB protein [Amycolatopsis tolypomycina]|uniref:CARDB protein n=1 Tax=Amycolatopsis tolypomycina TaxID=208445 RepID=A0A1H4UBQ3_9PSEU|nr:CARDB protein [Amycolatopsis tolypomycina]